MGERSALAITYPAAFKIQNNKQMNQLCFALRILFKEQANERSRIEISLKNVRGVMRDNGK